MCMNVCVCVCVCTYTYSLSSDPTSPTAATATAAESITTPPLAVAGAASSDDVGTQPVCAFCGSADAPLSFGDCEPEHFPTSADFRISSLRRGAHQAPLGSLSMDKLTGEIAAVRHALVRVVMVHIATMLT